VCGREVQVLKWWGDDVPASWKQVLRLPICAVPIHQNAIKRTGFATSPKQLPVHPSMPKIHRPSNGRCTPHLCSPYPLQQTENDTMESPNHKESVDFLRALPLSPGASDTLLLGLDHNNNKDLIEEALSPSHCPSSRTPRSPSRSPLPLSLRILPPALPSSCCRSSFTHSSCALPRAFPYPLPFLTIHLVLIHGHQRRHRRPHFNIHNLNK